MIWSRITDRTCGRRRSHRRHLLATLALLIGITVPRASEALDSYLTWETMLCQSSSIVELELTVKDRVWGKGKYVSAIEVRDVLMNLSDPAKPPTFDDSVRLQSALEQRLNWLRMRAGKKKKLRAWFVDPTDPSTWRVVVFFYQVHDSTVHAEMFGAANSSGVAWLNHRLHRAWRKKLVRYIKRRVRAHDRGAALPTFCARRSRDASAFQRFTLPPPCQEPCED